MMLIRRVVLAAFALCFAFVIGIRPMRAGAVELKSPTMTLGVPFACADYGGNKVCLVDAKGKVIWSHAARSPQDVWVLKNGNLLYSHVKGVVEITRRHKVVWEYQADPKFEIHACQPLPDGRVLIAESGPKRLIEVDRDGTIRKTIPLQIKATRTHSQMRGARKTKAGTYLVGQWKDNVVREYDANGKIIRDFPLEQGFVGIRLPNGNTLCSQGDHHCVVELDPKGKVVWEVRENDLPGNPLRFAAGMQRLPNGNTLICNWGGHGHVGQQPQIVEVTPDKKVAGVVFDNEQFKTISGVYVMGTGADPANFEVLR